jgi:hypothetical protein
MGAWIPKGPRTACIVARAASVAVGPAVPGRRGIAVVIAVPGRVRLRLWLLDTRALPRLSAVLGRLLLTLMRMRPASLDSATSCSCRTAERSGGGSVR